MTKVVVLLVGLVFFFFFFLGGMGKINFFVFVLGEDNA